MPRGCGGCIGVGPGQIARLTIVNHPLEEVAAFVPCIAEIRSLEGKVLARAENKLEPGTSAVLDFGPVEDRTEVYGIIIYGYGAGDFVPGDDLTSDAIWTYRATLQVIDNDGTTRGVVELTPLVPTVRLAKTIL